jgi:hypothetical protein
VVKSLLLVGAAFLSAQIIPAMAADMAPLDRVIAPPFSWTGVYLGADLGGAWSNIQAGSLGTTDAGRSHGRRSTKVGHASHSRFQAAAFVIMVTTGWPKG